MVIVERNHRPYRKPVLSVASGLPSSVPSLKHDWLVSNRIGEFIIRTERHIPNFPIGSMVPQCLGFIEAANNNSILRLEPSLARAETKQHEVLVTSFDDC